MWRRWSDYDDSRPLRPWLAGIAFRVARCHIRRRPAGLVLADVTTGEGPVMGRAATEVVAQDEQEQASREARELVLSALARLPERHRLPLTLHELDELSPQEIAKLLELPLSTVYTRVRRARLAFAKAVTELQGSPVAGRLTRVAGVGPLQLLASERQVPPAPALARARAEAFAEAVVRLPALPPDPLSSEGLFLGRSGVPGRWGALQPVAGVGPFALMALLAAAGLVVVAGALRSPGRRLAPPTSLESVSPDQSGRTARPPRLRLKPLPSFRPAPAALPGWYSPEVARGLALGLTGYWPLDEEGSARIARDHSGAGRHCLLQEARTDDVWISGVTGRALSLQATTWLQCPQPDTTRGNLQALSVAAWVKRRSVRAPAAIVTRQIGTGFQDHFFFGFDAVSLRVVGHGWRARVSVPAPPPSESWHHVAFTIDGDGMVRLYLAGMEMAMLPGPAAGTSVVVDTPITIGAGRHTRTLHQVRQRFDGAIDEVLIYDRPLSALEVRALAARVRPALAQLPGLGVVTR